jgi:hypothetical protein
VDVGAEDGGELALHTQPLQDNLAATGRVKSCLRRLVFSNNSTQTWAVIPFLFAGSFPGTFPNTSSTFRVWDAGISSFPGA